MTYHFKIYRKKKFQPDAAIRYRMYAGQADKYDVRIEDYRQIYDRPCEQTDTAGRIHRMLDKNPPEILQGGLLIGDVIVLNQNGVVTSYYVEANGLRILPGFIRNKAEGTVIDMDTSGYEIQGKKGIWETCDQLLIDGEHFYLMENMTYRKDAAFAILDAYGKLIVSDNTNGFDSGTIAEIRKWMYEKRRLAEESQQASQMTVTKDKDEPQRDQNVQDLQQNREQNLQNKREMVLAKMAAMPQGSRLLLYQKYNENGMYERAVESSMEQNYDMIDGNHNNLSEEKTSGQVVQKSEKGGKVAGKTIAASGRPFVPKFYRERISIIWRLRQKQNEVARKYGRPEPYENLEPELAIGSRS